MNHKTIVRGPLWLIDSANEEFPFDLGLDFGSTLPGIRCDLCGETWAESNFVDFELPPTAKAVVQFGERCVSRVRFEEILGRLVAAGVSKQAASELLPGARFLPVTLTGKPRKLGNAVFIGELIISETIRIALESAKVEGVSFVNVGSFGNSDGNYFLLNPTGGSVVGIGWRKEELCEGCNFCTYYRGKFDSDDIDPSTFKKHITISREAARQTDAFRLSTTSYIIVSDRLKKVLETFDLQGHLDFFPVHVAS